MTALFDRKRPYGELKAGIDAAAARRLGPAVFPRALPGMGHAIVFSALGFTGRQRT